MGMTTLPLVLDDEPMGIILRAGQQILRPAKIWAYCWFLDEGEDGDHTHRHLPVDPLQNQTGAGAEPAPVVAYGLYASTMFVGTP